MGIPIRHWHARQGWYLGVFGLRSFAERGFADFYASRSLKFASSLNAAIVNGHHGLVAIASSELAQLPAADTES
jgi:hypothetical protein